MSLLRGLSRAKAALGGMLPFQRCFELAAKGEDQAALQLLLHTRNATRENQFAPWDLELQLLEAFLALERQDHAGAQNALRGFFRRLRAETAYNSDEKAVLTRYGISILWLSRGKQNHSCLLYIRHNQTFDRRKVQKAILDRFPNPDEVS